MALNTTLVHWHIINGEKDNDLPDADLTVLVYDAHLDDVVDSCIEIDGERTYFADALTGEELVKPLWWAEKPFPEDI